MTFLGCSLGNAETVDIPDPAKDEQRVDLPKEKKLVVAGGCFWGVEAIFRHTKGVKHVMSGYTGGTAESASYDKVSSGKTGHAEAVEITYDPSQITIGQLLKVFFGVVHNPTELNKQGPDHGTQYRSAVFYADDNQKNIAAAYITQLDETGRFGEKIVTTLEPLDKFYPSEPYHHNFVENHPDNPYVMIHDAPKLTAFEQTMKNLYVK